MDFSGLQGLRGRHRLSEAKLHNPFAPATAADAPFLELVLGTGTDRAPISWRCKTGPGQLSIQGPASSGKTSLLTSMASQASGHLEVFAYLNGGTNRPAGFKGYTNDPDSAIELLSDARASMRSALRQVQDSEDSLPTDVRRSSSPRMDLSALAGKSSPIWHPMTSVVFIDDFDALCREWIRGGAHPDHPESPYGLVKELATDGARGGLSIVIAGRSLARSALPYRNRGGIQPSSKLLVGPSTLPERETFLDTDVASIDVVQGFGLYESWQSHAAEIVHLGPTKV